MGCSCRHAARENRVGAKAERSISGTRPATRWAISRPVLAAVAERLAKADAFLAHMSWDRTWQGMQALIGQVARNVGRTSQGRAVTTAPVGTIAAGPAAQA